MESSKVNEGSGELLTVQQVADILCCHRSRVYEFLKRGQLEGFDYNQGFGGSKDIKIKKASVEVFFNRCKIAPPEPIKPRYIRTRFNRK